MRFMDSFERLMAAAAFAQADCWDAMYTIMNEKRPTAFKQRSVRLRNDSEQRPVLRA